jgi:hypothetical protein
MPTETEYVFLDRMTGITGYTGGSWECWRQYKTWNTYRIASNSLSVLFVFFDSLAPARLALRANLRLLYLKGPAFSIVVKSAAFGLK